MAALDFPDAPTVGQVFDKWTWNGTMWVLTPGGGAGYVFVQDTAPTARKVGDTWFDTSTGATGGTSWVAIEEGAVGSEKVWVQTSPGAGGPLYKIAHYNPIIAVSTAMTTANQTFITQAMPAAPAGTLLDISFTVYHNNSVGTGPVYYFVEVNAVVLYPTLVLADNTMLASHTARVVAVVPPVGIPYSITLRGVKTNAGGYAGPTAPHTNLSIVAYTPGG